ncbi:hypothetical protein TKK_0008953 [Trichogramma kaykai]
MTDSPTINNFVQKQKQKSVYNYVSLVIQQHQHVLSSMGKVIKVSNSIYRAGMLSVIFNFSISGCMMVIHINSDTSYALRMVSAYIVCILFLFAGSYPSQKLKNAASDIHLKCYFTEWYRFSPTTRQLLQFMMITAMNPTTITIIPPNTQFVFQTCTSVLRLSMSYITTLVSVISLK